MNSMDVRDKLRKSLNEANEPVYRTPNTGFSPSLPSASQMSTSSVTSSSPSSSSIPAIPNFNPELLKEISDDYLKSILASVNSTPQINSSYSPGISSSSSYDAPYLARQLSELCRREEDIYHRRKELETQLAEIRIQESDLFNQRSFLVKQLELVVKCQTTSTTSNTPPVSLPSSSRLSTTIIESVESEPSAYRPPAITESNTHLNKKRPGPASKTCPPNTGISSPLTPSTPISQAKANLFKKPRMDENDSSKKTVTSGVKQSRPQPMRARKRTAPSELLTANEQRSGTQSKPAQLTQLPQPPQPSKPPQSSSNQTIPTKSAPEKAKSSTLSSKSDQQKSNSSRDTPKVYPPIEPTAKIKKEPTSKKSESNKVTKDEPSATLSNSTTGQSNDDACSDSDIFVHLGKIKTEPSSVNLANVKIEKQNIKTEPKDK